MVITCCMGDGCSLQRYDNGDTIIRDIIRVNEIDRSIYVGTTDRTYKTLERDRTSLEHICADVDWEMTIGIDTN